MRCAPGHTGIPPAPSPKSSSSLTYLLDPAPASRPQGLLPAEGRRLLSGLSLNVFTPAMLFSKLAGGVGVAEVAGMWVLTASMVARWVVGGGGARGKALRGGDGAGQWSLVA